MINRNFRIAVCSGLSLAFLAFSACEKQGPLERAGEELDEAGRAIKNGGEQTAADKLDDKIDSARKDINDARNELKKDAGK